MLVIERVKSYRDHFEAAYAEWAYWTEMSNAYSSYYGEDDVRPYPVNRWRFTYEMATAFLDPGHLMCRWFGHGHHWVDESYGGPDSGAGGGHCTRCGFSFYHQMY